MKKIIKYLLVSLAMMVTLPHDLFAHSVAQLQTTKYFHPDTVNMLVTRIYQAVRAGIEWAAFQVVNSAFNAAAATTCATTFAQNSLGKR